MSIYSFKNKLKDVKVIYRPAKRLASILYYIYDLRQNVSYRKWLEHQNYSDNTEVLSVKPLISIVVPVYKTPIKFLREMINSVLAQTYGNWELIIVDDASGDNKLTRTIESYSELDPRIRLRTLTKNLNISGSTNVGIKLARGDYISLLDHDDILNPNALWEVAYSINKTGAYFIYTDEDKVFGSRAKHGQPFFKPDWNQDLLYSVNYITHFTTIRKDILLKHGLEKSIYNGAQDWELFLRITRSIGATKISHIPKILYSWRVHERSTSGNLGAKPYVIDSQRGAINSELKKTKINNYSLSQDDKYPGQWKLSPKSNPGKNVTVCIPIELEQKRSEISRRTKHPKVDFLLLEENYTIKDVLRESKGEFIVFVDESTEVMDEDWISKMIFDASRPDIGVVLAKIHTKGVMFNLQSILENEKVKMISRYSNRAVSKHIYTTARYNVGGIESGTVMVSKEKLRSIYKEHNLHTIYQLSPMFPMHGLRNLYNPTVKMLK